MSSQTRKKQTEDIVRKRWGEWLTKRFIEMMSQRGRTLTITEFAEILGEERSKVEKWLPGKAVPSGGSIINIANIFGPEVYDILEIPRPVLSMDELVDNLLDRLPEVAERNPQLFNELLQRIKDLDNEPAPSPQSYPRPAENGV